VAAEVPFFVVGCPRSGTTLLRWMLEEHPRLAIPPEAEWLVEVAPHWSEERHEQVLDEIIGHWRYPDWELPAEEARAAVARRRPTSYAELVATLFGLYAARQGKPRWGDKTPSNVLHLDLLDRLFGDAVFVHVIRDGREVAASLTEQGWTDAGIVDHADWWRECVTAGRLAGRRLGPERYCEIRLEDLVADPEKGLRRVCAGIGEPYTPRMLGYTRRSTELAGLTPEDWRSRQHLAKPPMAGLRDWEAGVSPGDREAVEHICRPLLRELGYEA
jgi:hypothetical protein